jgi:hypothetical protein
MARSNPERFSEEYFYQVGLAVGELGRALEGYREISVQLTGFSVRGPRDRGDEFLVVVRGTDEEGMPVVGFSSALDLGEALRGVVSRLDNGSMKWRPDEYAR